LRSKEEADDYRYFPEPDLTPFHITDEFLKTVKEALPELPEALEKKYKEVFHLSEYDAQVICGDKISVAFFEDIIKHTNHYKAVANWMMGPVKSYLNENNLELSSFPLPAKKIAALIQLVDDGKVNFSVASSKIFSTLLNQPEKEPLQIATELNLLQDHDENSLTAWIDEVIAKMPDKVKEYKSGKKGLLGLFAGEIKKLSKGKADMQLVNKLLAEKLN
jgi:aspartyl-tRNA(Asn)/glutamyl-tRNA(Gln) amidotransferase subunit B